MIKTQWLIAGIVVATIAVVGVVTFSMNDSVDESAVIPKEEGRMMNENSEPADAAAGEKESAGMMQEGDGVMVKEDMNEMAGKSGAMTKGSYEPYDQTKLSLAANGKVILFFNASWCPTCRGVDADIRAHLGDIPAGVAILNVNYDDSTALKQKYGVTYQHTFVQVDANGNQIAKWSGSPTLASLISQAK